MNKLNLVILLIACAACASPAESISRWFSATFQDLKFTLRRFGHCVSELNPVTDYNLNETDYLIHQIRVFLDQANFDNEQLANVTALMDNICRDDNSDSTYPISVHIDVNKYSGATGKENRCRAIDEAMDSMFFAFKRAAMNKSEPLDFSAIQFYPNATDRSVSYNLTDLVNTSWIKSETNLDSICKITRPVKDYVQSRTSTSVAQKRSERTGVMNSLIEFLDRLLEPILGLQKRLYWEGTNRFEQISTRLNSGFGSLRDGIGSRVKSTRDRVTYLFTSPASNSTRTASSVNSTSVALNATSSALNSTTTQSVPKMNTTTVGLNGSSSSNLSSESITVTTRPPVVVTNLLA